MVANSGTGARYSEIYNSWTATYKKAGVDGKPGVDKLRLHDLRHTTGTKLAGLERI